MGNGIIFTPAVLRHRSVQTFFNDTGTSDPLAFSNSTYVFRIVHLSCDPVRDQVGSPPAHRQQQRPQILEGLTRIRRRSVAFHCF